MDGYVGTFKPEHGRLHSENTEAFRRFLTANDGVELHGEFSQVAKTSEKERMYNYFHGVVLHCFVDAMTHAGYEGMHRGKAEVILKDKYAFEIFDNPLTGETMKRLLSKRDFTKKRMIKFLKDSIMFIEMELGWEVPDSEKYLMMQDDY